MLHRQEETSKLTRQQSAVEQQIDERFRNALSRQCNDTLCHIHQNGGIQAHPSEYQALQRVQNAVSEGYRPNYTWNSWFPGALAGLGTHQLLQQVRMRTPPLFARYPLPSVAGLVVGASVAYDQAQRAVRAAQVQAVQPLVHLPLIETQTTAARLVCPTVSHVYQSMARRGTLEQQQALAFPQQAVTQKWVELVKNCERRSLYELKKERLPPSQTTSVISSSSFTHPAAMVVRTDRHTNLLVFGDETHVEEVLLSSKRTSS